MIFILTKCLLIILASITKPQKKVIKQIINVVPAIHTFIKIKIFKPKLFFNNYAYENISLSFLKLLSLLTFYFL